MKTFLPNQNDDPQCTQDENIRKKFRLCARHASKKYAAKRSIPARRSDSAWFAKDGKQAALGMVRSAIQGHGPMARERSIS